MPRLPGETEEDFDARWHRTYDDFNNRLRAAGADRSPVRQWPQDLREEVEESWECFFDRSYFGPKDYWEATVHEIHIDDVVEAVRITK